MHIVGVIEMLVGLAILTKWTRVGAYVCSAWLVLIALNLVMAGMFLDVAVRDLEMALAAFVLARLTEVRGKSFLNNFREQGFRSTVIREEQRQALVQPM